MAHHLSDAQYKKQVWSVWKSTIILSVITMAEIGMALLSYYDIFHMPGISLFMVVLSLLKAYFIVGEFMHINYETRALTLTILSPLVFLVYGVIMFMMEGNAWNVMRSHDLSSLAGDMFLWIGVLVVLFGAAIFGPMVYQSIKARNKY